MAKQKYKTSIAWMLEKEDGTKMANAQGEWTNLEYEDVVKFEAAVMPALIMALGGLGQAEIENKKKTP